MVVIVVEHGGCSWSFMVVNESPASDATGHEHRLLMELDGDSFLFLFCSFWSKTTLIATWSEECAKDRPGP